MGRGAPTIAGMALIGIGVATDPAAPHLLDLTTTSGDVTVREK